MDPAFWHDRWQQGQIGFHRQEHHPKLARWWSELALAAAARVLVPLCGKSRDMLYLASLGHEVIGCELSPLAAEAFFAEAGLQPEREAHSGFERWQSSDITILVGDFFGLTPADVGHVTALYDRAALVALPPAMRRDYAAQLARLMTAGSQGLLLALDYPQESMQGPPFSVDADEVQATVGRYFGVELLDRRAAADVPAKLRESGADMHESVYRLRLTPS